MESKDPTVFTKTYEEGVERVLKVVKLIIKMVMVMKTMTLHRTLLFVSFIPLHFQGNFAFLCESAMLDYFVQQDCNLTQIGGLLDSKVSQSHRVVVVLVLILVLPL